MEAFWRLGFTGTGLADLEKSMGLGRQSIYNAFGDKDDLFEAALKLYIESQIRHLTEVLGQGGSPLANVSQALDLWEDNLAGGDGSGCMIANSICEIDGLHAEREEVLKRVVGQIEAAFLRTFAAAQEEGELNPESDIASLARLFATLGQGLSVVSRVEDPEFVRGAIRGARQLVAPAG